MCSSHPDAVASEQTKAAIFASLVRSNYGENDSNIINNVILTATYLLILTDIILSFIL